MSCSNEGDSDPAEDRGFQLSDLNTSFYASDPIRYFRSRWLMLLVVGGKTDELDALVRGGTRYDEITIEPGQFAWPRPEEDPAEFAFLLIESEALLHQSTETLIRLIIAHAAAPESPWLEMASLTSFSRFKTLAEELAQKDWPEALESQHDAVVLGRRPEGPRRDDEAATATRRLTRHLADLYLSRAHVYNALKHGLAVQAAQASFALGPGSDGSVFRAEGPAFNFLEFERDGDHRQWFERTAWVDVRTNLWLVQLALVQMQCVWDVARARYTGAELRGVNIVTSEAIEAAIWGSMAPRTSLLNLRMQVATECLH